MTTGGKGSRPRPYSVDQNTFDKNWDMIFRNKIKSPVKLINPLNSEDWLCDDLSDTKVIDGVEYVQVYKSDNPNRTHLMRKDALKVNKG